MDIIPGVEIDCLVRNDSRQFEFDSLAKLVINQDRYLWQDHPHTLVSQILVASDFGKVAGFLRMLI